MLKIETLLATCALIAAMPAATLAQTQTGRSAGPRLVVGVTLSGVPHEAIEKLAGRFTAEGFGRFAGAGTVYSAAHLGYMQTLAPAGVATLTTGVDPSMHGVVAASWMDYVTGTRVSLVGDDEVQGVGGDAGEGRFSPRHVVMPTVGDRLVAESPASRVVSVAADPASAIVAGGRSGRAYWMDGRRAVWVSSTAYVAALPDWIVAHNVAHTAEGYADAGWTPARPARSYLNARNTIFGGEGGGRRVTSFSRGSAIDYEAMVASPVGNTLVADFARRAVTGEGLGTDDATDMLYVTFDASRRVGERFGAGSMEYEDMLYRLDMDMGAMMSAIENEVGVGRVLFVLASDGGVGDAAGAVERFNVAQFKTILNSFLGVQFGPGEWVLDYIDRQVYLNRNLVYGRGLNLEDVQNRAAAFVLQFRGVSHVLTSTALSGGYFASGYGAMMQRGFYPRRAGDLTLNLMPGWVEERADVRSLSGSMYDYDTHVPLALAGWRVEAGRVVKAPVDVRALAPTLARIMGIGRPTGSDGATLPGLDGLTMDN